MSARIKVPYTVYVTILVHRILSGHRANETCPECGSLCRHCGDYGPQGTDHTCPCPNSDDDCTEHLLPAVDAGEEA